MAATKDTTKGSAGPTAITIERIQTGKVRVHLVGREPLIYNAMSKHAKEGLLAPRPKMNAVERAVNLKHDPLAEYRGSVYRMPDAECPVLLAMPSTAFKAAMLTAALDLPGTKKAQIGRLVWVKGTYIPICGTPQLLMSVVRSADMNRTPDIRTRAILPQWACYIDIEFVKPLIQDQGVGNLVHAAGYTAGIGDWRIEKGKGNFGAYKVVDAEDPEYLAITQEGRAAQLAALENPTCFDNETSELLGWYEAEMERRKQQGRMPKGRGKRESEPGEAVVQ